MSDKVKNTQALLDLILDGVSVGIDAEKDGKIGIEDVGLLLKLVPDLGPAFADVGAVPAELAAMDEADAVALVAHVMEKLAVQDAHARAVIDKGLKAAVAVYELVKEIKAPAPAVAAPADPAPAAPAAPSA